MDTNQASGKSGAIESSSIVGLRSQARYDAVKQKLERPMVLLAVLLGLLVGVPVASPVSPGVEAWIDRIAWLIWLLFVAEYAALLAVAPDRRQMIRDHPLELLLLVVPIFRSVRALRAVALLVGAQASYSTISKVMDRKGLQWFLIVAAGVISAGALAVLGVERHEEGTQIVDLGDALWWAIVTCTTVGYGDVAPITPAGQVIAVVLMLLGISIVSVVTAHIASVMIEEDTESDLLRLETKIDRLTAQLEGLSQSNVDYP